jgi:mutator protein MutT
VTYYADPKLAVAVLVEHQNTLVLQRRTIDPGLGKWTFPSGFVERGERVEDAAIREVLEETGLRIRIDRLLGLYSYPDNPVALAVYVGRSVGGKMSAGDECDAVELFDPDNLPSLAFPHDASIIQSWREHLAGPVWTGSPDVLPDRSEETGEGIHGESTKDDAH